MRALVTGGGGFVGGYLVAALRASGYDVLACGGPKDRGDLLPIDLADQTSLRAALDLAKPDVVFHLAAQTFVPASFADPPATYGTNVLGTARLTQAMREYAGGATTAPRLLFVSSAEVYGAREAADFPLRETADLRPANPYAASKAAAEALVLAESRSLGLDVVIARAFNHIGPGQDERFAVPGFAMQLARIAAGRATELWVGNLDAKRDFLDVRDVVAAYVLLAQGGAPGETYNVCSGAARSIREVLRELILAAHVPVEVREDVARMRPSDVPLFVGSGERLRAATAWEPRIALTQSIRDVYSDAVDRAAGELPGPQ